MLDLPVWLKSAVPNLQCPHCDHAMRDDSILSVGIRHSARDKVKTVLFFEYECYSCQNRSVVELNSMTLNEFATCLYTNKVPDVPDKTTGVKVPAKKKIGYHKMRRSKISDTETKKALDWIRSCDNNVDFLLGIGLSRVEISEYLDMPKQPNKSRKRTRGNK